MLLIDEELIIPPDPMLQEETATGPLEAMSEKVGIV